MPFEKADKNINREGRPKGTSFSIKLRDQVTSYCEENLDYFLEEIKSMRNGHAKSQAFLTLLNYAIPKLTQNNTELDLESLTDAQVDLIIKKISNDE